MKWRLDPTHPLTVTTVFLSLLLFSLLLEMLPGTDDVTKFRGISVFS